MSNLLRLAAYTVLGPRLGLLPDVLEEQWTVPLRDLPTLTFSYPASGRHGDLLDGHLEIGVEMFDGAAWVEPPAARLHVLKRSSDLSDPTQTLKAEALGVGWLLRRARVWTRDGQMNSDGKRAFNSATAGKILGDILTDAKARGWGTGAAGGMLGWSFTATKDSAGQAWSKVVSIAYDPSMDAEDVLSNLVDQGVCDARWQGRTLQLYNPDTVMAPDFTATVRVRPNWSDSAPEDTTLEDLVTAARVDGEAGATWQATNPAADPTFGRLEGYVTQGGVSTEATARALADAVLAGAGQAKTSRTRTFHVDAGGPIPVRDYPVGALVKVDTQAGVRLLRAASVTFAQGSSGTTGHTVFGDTSDDLLVRVAKRTKGITGGATFAGGSGARPAT